MILKGFSLSAIAIIILLFPSTCQGQNNNPIVSDSIFDITRNGLVGDMSFAFSTQNYFRGLLNSKSPSLSTQAGFIWKDWIFGMFGGVGFDGVYQETDFILIYRQPWFDLHLEYYYNFTQGITDIPDASGLFDFNTKTTRGLLDFIIHVNLDKKKHWRLTSSTFLFGRDTDLEEEIVGMDTITVRTDQRYSQYLELQYTWYWNNNLVQAHIGGSFSWNAPADPQFYGESPGFNNIGVSYTKKFKINDNITIPVKASALLNPLAETVYLILTVNLIQLSKL